MNDRDKSKSLCIAMKWQATWSSGTGKVLLDQNLAIISYEQEDGLPDLYESYRFPLMWKAVEWVSGCHLPIESKDPKVASLPIATHFGYWWEKANLWAYEQEDFQRVVLNKIFELAVAAKSITVTEE